MRHPGTLLLASVAPMLLAVSAHAAAIDTFTVTSTTGGGTMTFQLPSSPTTITVDPDGIDFQVYGVTTSAGLSNILLFGTGDAGGLEVETPQNVPIVNGYGPQLYTGSASAPTFLTGTFILTDPASGGVIDSVTIAPLASTVTPEPSSLILLGTGALGLLGAARRKFTL